MTGLPLSRAKSGAPVGVNHIMFLGFEDFMFMCIYQM